MLIIAGGAATAADVTFDATIECGNGTAFAPVGPDEYSFALEPDTHHTDTYWFCFDVVGAAGRTLTLRMTGADKTRVPGHWKTALPVASPDGGATWGHIDGEARVDGTDFVFTHTFTRSRERIAMHFPYTFSRVQEKIAGWSTQPGVTHLVLGESVEGRPIDLLRLDPPEGRKPGRLGLWIVARQHAAEVTGSYFMEGFVDFVLSDAPEARALRAGATINVVPMLNPDGVVLGNCRYNALGVNLNRVWDAPDPETAPEILALLSAIKGWNASGEPYDFFADLHSSAGAYPHFAYHAAADVDPPMTPYPSAYHDNSVRFLKLMERHAPQLDVGRGLSRSPDYTFSRQNQAIDHGVLAFTFEAGYNRVLSGPDADKMMSLATHTEMGPAMARALVEYFEIPPVGATAGDDDASKLPETNASTTPPGEVAE